MVKVVYVLLVVVASYLQAAKLPKFIVPCSKSDPNLEECAKQHGQDAIPFIIKGNQEFKVSSLSPLFLAEVQFSTGDLHVDLTNVTILGLERTTIGEVHIQLEKQNMGVTVFVDKVIILAHYNISGSVLGLSLSGNGAVNITLVDSEYSYQFNYTLKDKQEKQYIEIQHDTLSFRARQGHFQFEDSEIGQLINTLLNQDWKSVQNEIGPTISQTIKTLIKSIVTGFTDRVPINDLFLP